MEMDLVTEDLWEGESYLLDDANEDVLNFDGERCGICMDVVIDRGVLDCCPHWFCFSCIDNWATITSLCPLCQTEFQLITCVPVYDTVGGYKTDEDTNRRDDDWFIEGKNNTLSFPSYYIDENAVVCLDEDGCKIRSGSVLVEEDLDIDTSIACDSCDKWYHAFCVGFNPESTCDSSWLCPSCTVDSICQKSEIDSSSIQSEQHSTVVSGGDQLVKSSFSERVSVSVVDDGETAIIISLLGGNHELKESALGCSKDTDNEFPSFITDMSKSEATLSDRDAVETNLIQQEMEVSLSQNNGCSSSQFLPTNELEMSNADEDKMVQTYLDSRVLDSCLDFDIGSSMYSYKAGMKDDDKGEDHATRNVDDISEEYPLPADEMVSSKMKVLPLPVNNPIPDEKGKPIRVTGSKRKLRDKRNVDDEEAIIEDTCSEKKIKVDRTAEPFVDISAIVQGTDHRSGSHLGHKTYSDIISKEREGAAGLRLKKIMRRTDDTTDSSALVQELRRKIREAVRDKSSKEHGQNHFDPKLLEAFRSALAGSVTENLKPTLDVKAKRSLLQKGKVRESLTKKIYGSGGKRRRAWTRECEVEFWKHRCMKTTKPEKVQTLNSVLHQLRDDTGYPINTTGKEEEAKVSILSRLYLADTSVFPRKNDIKPVSAFKDAAIPEQIRASGLPERATTSSSVDLSDRISLNNCLLQGVAPALDGKGINKSAKGLKPSNDVDKKMFVKGSSVPESGGIKISSIKETVIKSDITKDDKRKWALDFLARKTASSSNNGIQGKDEDGAVLKGNYSLLAQLPKEKRPVLAPSRHNKISMPVRQAQLYRLTEHFLKKVNPSSASRTAETELAVVDAVNIEKEIADKSNSKLVYVNLCSQELLRRSDNMNSDRTKESNICSTSKDLSDTAEDEINNNFSDLVVDEALRNAGLVSDSPPNSPKHLGNGIRGEVVSVEKVEDEEPNTVFEVSSHPKIDLYGYFENNLEASNFMGTEGPDISKLQSEPRLALSSLNLDSANGALSHHDQERVMDSRPSENKSLLLESRHRTNAGCSNQDSRLVSCPVQKTHVDGNDEPSLVECEKHCGPEKEPLAQKHPEAISEKKLRDDVDMEKDSAQPNGDHMENLKVTSNSNSSSALDESSSQIQNRENEMKEQKSDDSKKQSESYNNVMRKVEAYIKEHVRPLCKSGVITVKQYRWAVQKTAEKVMKYHSKEKTANFLIQEGEKVKKLAEQYVEAAQHKVK